MKVVKNGVKRTGRQNSLCRACGKRFQFEYAKAGCRPASKQLALRMLVRNSGVRDVEQVTGVHRQAVLRRLNQRAESLEAKPRPKAYRSDG
jgi:insertion element IS1 protein InsB